MNPNQPRFKILFLCTGNSARSILAEYLLKTLGHARFDVFSAGASPKASVNPLAIKTLKEHFKIDASDARSKSWTEFENVNFDFVITLCDSAKETCPVWPGQPVIAHWSTPDPSDVHGTDQEKLDAFWKVAFQIKYRLELLISLPFEKLDSVRLERATQEIAVQQKDTPDLP
jgi:arsenate reductase